MAGFYMQMDGNQLHYRAIVRGGTSGDLAYASPEFGVLEKRTEREMTVYYYQLPQI